MKKRTLYTFMIFLVVPLLFIIGFLQEIIVDFKSKPTEYFIQYIIMIIPIVISLILFYIESKDRKNGEKQQKMQLKEQKKHQDYMQESLERLTKILGTQISQQIEISHHLDETATELRRIRLPQAYEFIYINYDSIKYILNKDTVVKNTYNVVALVTSIREKVKEWDEIKLEEIPLSIQKEFQSTKYFFGVYSKLLSASYFYLVKKEQENGNIQNSNVFEVTLSNEIPVTDLISDVITKLNSLSLEHQKNLEDDEKLLISVFNSKEKVIKAIEDFSIDLENMYQIINEGKPKYF